MPRKGRAPARKCAASLANGPRPIPAQHLQGGRGLILRRLPDPTCEPPLPVGRGVGGPALAPTVLQVPERGVVAMAVVGVSGGPARWPRASEIEWLTLTRKSPRCSSKTSKNSVNKGLGILSILKQISQNDGLETVKLPIGWHQTISTWN